MGVETGFHEGGGKWSCWLTRVSGQLALYQQTKNEQIIMVARITRAVLCKYMYV